MKKINNSIYIHIPFCRRACYYCDFHFSTSVRYKKELLSALKKEIYLRKDYFRSSSAGNKPGKTDIQSVYFGGGTPSMLSVEEIQSVLEALHDCFSVDTGAEITIEANPDDLTPDKVKGLKKLNFNRLSIGVQSFFDEDLKYLHRIHDRTQAIKAIELSREAGFENINIDLISGVPGLSDENWLKNLDIAVRTGITHLSAYTLTVEKGTPLYHLIRRKKCRTVDEEQSARQYELGMDFMESKKFIHYEISNFAKEGFLSGHNISYWTGGKYLGLGPSAHSYDGASRQWNVSNNIKYIDAIEKNLSFFEREESDSRMRMNEYILTSLRTMWGCNLRERLFEHDNGNRVYESAEKHIKTGHLKLAGNTLLLTKPGKLFADRIISDLFI